MKQKYNVEYHRQYYAIHRDEILEKQKAQRQRKKLEAKKRVMKASKQTVESKLQEAITNVVAICELVLNENNILKQQVASLRKENDECSEWKDKLKKFFNL